MLHLNPTQANPAAVAPGGFSTNPIIGLLQGIFGLLMDLLTGGLMGSLLGGGPQNLTPGGNPGFGGCSSPGYAGSAGKAATSFLGGRTSAGFGSGRAPRVALSSVRGGNAFGRRLAQDAASHANGPGGWCFRWVRQALERNGVRGVGGASAYMAADQLAKNPKFREVSIPPRQFKRLPPGAVVVWDKGNGNPHGHISIALGDGREASDKIRPQTTTHGTRARVFLPKS